LSGGNTLVLGGTTDTGTEPVNNQPALHAPLGKITASCYYNGEFYMMQTDGSKIFKYDKDGIIKFLKQDPANIVEVSLMTLSKDLLYYFDNQLHQILTYSLADIVTPPVVVAGNKAQNPSNIHTEGEDVMEKAMFPITAILIDDNVIYTASKLNEQAK